ncbi:MAG: HlyD family secretion protein [Desulfobacteraceae bacterium]|nr:HlyD family secretion protein [Desulfobacteraceae bacterium]
MAQQPNENGNMADAAAKENGLGASTAGPGGRPPARRRFALKSRTSLVLAGFIVAFAICAGFYFWYSGRYESTDDAQVDGHIDPVSARVAGHIDRVYVDNGQAVTAGTLLATIDSSDYQNDYDHAKAAYDQAVADDRAAQLEALVTGTNTTDRIEETRAGLKVAQTNIAASQQALEVAQAGQRQAQAQNELASKNLKRAEQLVLQKVISRQSYDQDETTARSTAAALAASQSKVAAAIKRVAQAKAQLDQARAELQDALSGPDQVAAAKAKAQSTAAAVKKAQATLAQARLNLQYTHITAPASGIIGNKGVEIGQNVSPGQVLMDLVQVDDVWVTADFKETQLRRIRVGQAVDIHVDAYGKDYKGRVASIGAATGEQFSLFPPENATGNYVKVVQRIPVKIVFNRDENRKHRLRPGMSVEPKVWIQ